MKKILILLVAFLVPAIVLGATLIITNNTPTAETFYNAANAHAQVGTYLEAIPLYEQALILDPDHEASLNDLAYIHNLLQDYDKAIPYLAVLVKNHPENTGYNYDYAINIILQIRKTNKGELVELETALNHFQKAEALSPNYKYAQQNIEFLEDLVGQYYAQE